VVSASVLAAVRFVIVELISPTILVYYYSASISLALSASRAISIESFKAYIFPLTFYNIWFENVEAT